MVRNFIFLFFLESIILCYKNEEELELSDFLFSVNKSVSNLFSTVSQNLANKTSNMCSIEIENNFKTSDFYTKFILDSSKNKNDLMSFFYCIHTNSTNNNKTNLDSIYILVKNYQFLHDNYLEKMIYPTNYLIGLCLPKNKKINCTENEYKEIVREIFDLRYELFQVNISNNKLETIIINKNEKIWPENILHIFFFPKILNFIPFLLIIIQIIFCIFPSIPKKLIRFIKFYVFCNKKRQNLNYSNLFAQIKKHFNISENIDELYGASKINNDSGLKYIIGIKGINIIMMIIGTVFQILINSPTHIYSYTYFENLMKNPFYGFIFYGVRYAPRILLSCSGFILSFKLLNFFDDKVDEIKEGKNSESKNNSLEINSNNSFVEKDKSKEEITLSLYYPLRFITYQLHKYFIYIFIIIFTKYSMYYLQNSVTPIWKYLYNTILLKTTYLHLIFQFTLIRPFLFGFSYPLKNESNSQNIIYDNIINSIFLDYYWIISNEIILFIIGVFYVYFFVKCKKYSLNYSIYFIIFFFIALKNLIWFLGFSTNEYLSYFGYGKMFINPLFNLSYYLFGIYFGMVHYLFEKRLSIEKIEKQNKMYLKNPFYKLDTFQKTKNKFLYKIIPIVYIIIIIFSLSQIITYNFMQKNEEESLLLKVFYLFDIELLIYWIFHVTMFHFIRGYSIIYSILTFNFWIKFHKLYFSYLLILPTISVYFLYQSESRITLSFSNILFYSVIIWIITEIFASLLFIFTEMPYKKVIKLLFVIRDKELEKEKNEIEEEKEQIPL